MQERSRITRQRIIDATIKLIAEGGINNITARKVAKQADVPLGTLTSKFESIQSLKEEAFNYYSGEQQKLIEHLKDNAFSVLATSKAENIPKKIGKMLAVFIESQITDTMDKQRLESSFLYSALLSENVKKDVIEQRQKYHKHAENWFEVMGSKKAEIHAYMFLAFIFYIERWSAIDVDFAKGDMPEKLFTKLFDNIIKEINAD